jgi:hypothetical protein
MYGPFAADQQGYPCPLSVFQNGGKQARGRSAQVIEQGVDNRLNDLAKHVAATGQKVRKTAASSSR